MKKQIIKFTVLVAFFTISISCNDFLDVNDDPTRPTISTPALTLPVAEKDILSLISTSMNDLGNFMVYNWATPSTSSRYNQNYIRYNFAPETLRSIWATSYAAIFKNLNYVENFEENGVDYSAYKAITKTLKAFQYQYLVDLYGNIPYTEANLRAENFTPAYDDAATIYKDLIAKLTEAAITATTLPTDAENPGNQDIIFKGNMTMWAQFANTLKLRFLIRISATGQDAYIKSEIAKINANGAGYITANATSNPGYSDDTSKQNPFFSYFGYSAGKTSPNGRNKAIIATDFVINYLGNFTNDPRMERLYAEAKNGGFHGAPQSTTLPSTGFKRDDMSHIGPGLLINSEQDQPLMLHAEALLLQAEAMVRGYISGGDALAKSKYEEAITSSFEFLKVPNATTAITTYLAQNLPNVAWDSSPSKLEAIATQKWVALNGINGAELWIETTRTGFPTNLPLSPEGSIASGGKRPVSILYPSTEIARNAENVPVQIEEAVFTHVPFWKN